MINRAVLEDELKKINEILEDHVMQRKEDKEAGCIEPLIPEEQEYLFELCFRKHQIKKLLKQEEEQ